MEYLCELVRISNQDPPTETVLDQFFGPTDEGQLSGILTQKRFARKHPNSAEIWEHSADKTLILRVVKPKHLRNLNLEDY